MGWIMQIAIGISLIILTGGLVNYLQNKIGGKIGGIQPDQAEAFEARLNELEKRLTDIQDVMIAIDEKMSRMEKSRNTDNTPS